ncbi:MAG: hypothetical protein N3A69_04140 [Leptospiraceae bacterium]|nr:hypothetical protein [Leptospiraceae bacterium]
MLADDKQAIIDLLKRQEVQIGLIDAGLYKTFSKEIYRDNKIWLHYLRKVDDERQCF